MSRLTLCGLLLSLAAGCPAGGLDGTPPGDGAPPSDAAAPIDPADAARGPDLAGPDGGGPRFSCGATTCAAQSEFCYRVLAGTRERPPGTPRPEALDGGLGPGCNPIPQGCGAAPMCRCLLDSITSCPRQSTFCQGGAAGFTVTCALP